MLNIASTAKSMAPPTASGKYLKLGLRFVASLFFLCLAIYFFRKQLAGINVADVRATLENLSASRIVLAVILTAASYLTLTCYDLLAVRHIKRRLAYARVAFTAFVTYTFNFNLGSVVGAVGMRYYLYSQWGFNTGDITRIALVTATIAWSGYSLAAGLVWTLGAIAITAPLKLPVTSFLPFGLLALLASGLYFYLCFKRRRPLRVRHFRLELAEPRRALFYCAVASVQWFLPSVVLFILMPPDVHVGFMEVWSIHLLAAIAGAMVHVPGGLGIMEGTFLFLLEDQVPASPLLAALLAYRAIYYFAPFILGSLCLLVATGKRLHSQARSSRTKST